MADAGFSASFNPLSSDTQGDGAFSEEASEARLREQAVKAFGILQRRSDREIAPERLREFLKGKPVTPETLFELLANFARAKGIVVVHRTIAPDALLDDGLVDDLVLLPSGEIGLVLDVRTYARDVTVHNLGSQTMQRYGVDELAEAYEDDLSILHVEGEAPRYLDDGKYAPPLYGDQKTAADPHDHIDNIKETFESLLRLISDESDDFVTVALYAVMVSLFALTIPLASQGIIDAVSMGTFTNQIVVFCAGISIGLLLYGVFTMLQYYTVDVLQRRLFAATGMEIAYRIPLMKRSALEGEYGPALINRFFDIITMQKSLAKILLDGLAYSLVALSSLVLLAIYSPFFLVIGLLAFLFAPILVRGLGRGGLKSSIKESSAKYAMAHWLEDLSRCHQSFKLNGAPSYVHARTDRLASQYVRARESHFRVFGRQLAGAAIFRALIVGLALGIGGYLVTRGDISLGQFVAAELVIVSLTDAGFNGVKLFEQGYDLLTAISKILHMTEKPLESVGGESMPQASGPAPLELRNVTVGYGDKPAIRDVSFRAEAGSHLSVVGKSGAGKSTLSRALVRLLSPTKGRITFDGYDAERLDLRAYRAEVGLVFSTEELFKGTLEENITLGRRFTYPELEKALYMACLEDEVLDLPQGLRTPVTSAGLEFPQGFVRRLMIARAVIGEPRVLIMDEAFSGMEEPAKRRLMERIYTNDSWTLITVTDDDPETVRRADHVIVLDEGSVVWTGKPSALGHEPDDFLEQHFPQLVTALRKSQTPPSP